MRTVFAVTILAACHPSSHDLGAESARPRAAWRYGEPVPSTATEAAAGEPAPPPRPLTRIVSRVGAPVVLARDGETTLAYVADEDASAIRVVDVDAQSEVARLPVPGRPAQLAMLDDRRLVATLRDRGELAVLTGTGLPGAPLAIAQRVPVPAEPIGLALGPADRELLVTSGWGKALTMLAVPPEPGRPLAVARTFEVAQEPRGVVVSDDGKFAFVSHAIGQHMERIELATGVVTKLGLAGHEESFEMEMEMSLVPREACQGFALAKSIEPAGRIFAPQVLAATGSPDQPSEGYGSGEGMEPEVFGVAVIDEDRGKVMGESLMLRAVARAGKCALPRAAATSARGSLFVACLGENAVLELDGAAIAPMNAELRRWSVPSGPVGIAIDDEHERAVVWSQYAHTLTTLVTKRAAPAIVRTVVLDTTPLAPQVARGRELFTSVADARISGTGQACESCHPDGRQDALVWSSPNGPRQTPMLAGRLADTGPYGWNGDATDVARHLKQTFSRLRGKGLKGEDLDALLAYVSAMRPPAPATATAPASASAADPARAALIAEGEAIFQSSDAQCASCHGEDGRTPDGMRHDVGSRARGDQRRELDTPSLSFLAGTAPYYHDGRFATLRELLVKSQGKMGQKRPLTPHELDALEAYLKTL